MAQPELGTPQGTRKDPLGAYSAGDLIALRARIDEYLPLQSLKNVNMEWELVTQLAVVKKLQSETFDMGEDVPANQRAQVAGQVANVLTSLAKLQIELYDSERMKKIEHILVETLNKLPEDSQAEFLDAYETALAGVQ